MDDIRIQAAQQGALAAAEELAIRVRELEAERDRLREGLHAALRAAARSQAEWRRLGAENDRLREAIRRHRCDVKFTTDGLPAFTPNDGEDLRLALEGEEDGFTPLHTADVVASAVVALEGGE